MIIPGNINALLAHDIIGTKTKESHKPKRCITTGHHKFNQTQDTSPTNLPMPP